MRRCCFAPARCRICCAGARPSSPIARPTGSRRNALANLRLALYSLRSLQEIRAETGIAYDRAPMACSRSTAIRNPSRSDAAMPRDAGRARPGLRGAVAGGMRRARAARWRRPRHRCAAPSTSRATRSATATSSCRAWPRYAQERGVTFHYETPSTGLGAERQPDRRGRDLAGADRGRQRRRGARQLYAALLRPGRHRRADLSGERRVDHRAARAPGTPRRRTPSSTMARMFGLIPIGDRLRAAGSAEIAALRRDAEPGPRPGDHRQGAADVPGLCALLFARAPRRSGRACAR